MVVAVVAEVVHAVHEAPYSNRSPEAPEAYPRCKKRLLRLLLTTVWYSLDKYLWTFSSLSIFFCREDLLLFIFVVLSLLLGLLSSCQKLKLNTYYLPFSFDDYYSVA